MRKIRKLKIYEKCNRSQNEVNEVNEINFVFVYFTIIGKSTQKQKLQSKEKEILKGSFRKLLLNASLLTPILTDLEQHFLMDL